MSGRNAWGTRGDDFIDSLRIKKDASGFRAYETTSGGIPFSHGNRNTPPLKQSRRRLTFRRGCGMLVAGTALVGTLACCSFLGSLFHAAPLNQQAVEQEQLPPEPAVTVTVTVTTTTAPTIPESCKEAIQQALTVLDSASRISSVSGTQLDIISKATRAILNKDQALMNEAAESQRRLESSTMHDAAALQIPFQQIKDGLATCP